MTLAQGSNDQLGFFLVDDAWHRKIGNRHLFIKRDVGVDEIGELSGPIRHFPARDKPDVRTSAAGLRTAEIFDVSAVS